MTRAHEIAGQITLAALGVIYLALGASGVLDPRGAAELAGMQAHSSTALVELRSAFGLYLGLAALFFFSAAIKIHLQAVLISALFVNIGLLGGRIFGAALDGLTEPISIYSGLVEAAACAVVGTVLWQRASAASKLECTTGGDSR